MGMKENSLLKNLRLISKFITSHTVKQITAIHILSNISRSKDNWAMKSRQLSKYNMGNIFFEKSWAS